MNSTTPDPDNQAARGWYAAVRVLLPGILLELAASALLGLWFAGYGVTWCLLGLCLHLGATWFIWMNRPETPKGCDSALKTRRHVITLTALMVAFLPIVGLPGMALALAIRSKSRRKGLVEVLTAEMRRSAQLLGVERVEDMEDFLREESSVEPIREILQGPDVGLKRGAIGCLGAMRNPRAVALIKESLSDPSPEVRFYAHATLTRIDDSYCQCIKDAQAALAGDDAEACAALGEACSLYASSGLMEEVMAAQYLSKACAAYAESLALEPDDHARRVRLGSLYLELGDFPNARECFEAVPGDDPSFVDAALGLCRICYEMRDYDGLYLVRRRLDTTDCRDCDPAKIITYRFWAQSGGMA